VRIGGIAGLKVRDLERKKVRDYNIYKIWIDRTSKKHNYIIFCTPECAAEDDDYLDYRKRAGEKIKPTSPLIREQFNPAESFMVNNPRHIKTGLVDYLINEVLTKISGIKPKLEYDYERKRRIGKHPTSMSHVLRVL